MLAVREAPGLRPLPARPSAFAGVLRSALRPAHVPTIRAVRTQGSHFARRDADLWSLAFVMRTQAAARAQTTAIVRAARGRAPRRVGVGQGGWLLGSAGAAGKQPVVVLWRRGVLIGAIVFAAPLDPGRRKAVALDYARVADRLMAQQLSRTAWERALDGIGPRGQVSRQTALDLFTLAYGPLPGTRPPPAPSGPIASGTVAAQLIFRHWGTLSAAQQEAAAKLLGAGNVRLARSSAPRRPAGRGRRHGSGQDRVLPCGPPDPNAPSAPANATFGDPGFVYDPALQKMANGFQLVYNTKLGHTLKLSICAGTSTDSTMKGYADALPVDPDGVNLAGSFCRVRLGPAGQKQSLVFQKLVIAHEVFHCYEFDVIGPDWISRPPWIMEGMADWAALTVDPVPWSVGGGNFGHYLATCSDTPLPGRSYDAVGFFGHVDDSVEPFFLRAKSVLTAGTSLGAYEAAGGSLPAFLGSWASSAVVRPEAGLQWTSYHPIAPTVGSGCPEVPVWQDSAIGADAFTTRSYRIDAAFSSEPLLHVEVFKGRARVGDGKVDALVDDAWFCLTGACECPSGTEGLPPPAPELGVPAHVALTGGKTTALGQLTFVPLEKYCKVKTKPPAIVPIRGGGASMQCSSGCGQSTGDPHLQTFDFVPYDFMAAGEFVLVRSKRGDLEVQVRQEPYPGSRVVSVTTGVAIRAGRDRIVVLKGTPLQVRLNGRAIMVTTRPLRLSQGVTLRSLAPEFKGFPGQLEVAWADGTILRLWAAGEEGLTVLVRPAAARTGQLAGLLGNFDGKAGNDFVTRGGARIDPSVIQRGTGGSAYRILYRSFAERWRITKRTSLFDYAPGQSTATFTNRRFPEPIPPVGKAATALLARARAVCERLGIKNEAALAGCIVDVVVTRDFSFAAAAARLERTARVKTPKPKAPKPKPPSPPPPSAIATATVSFLGKTLTFRAAPTDDGCGPFGNVRFRVFIGTYDQGDNRPVFVLAVPDGAQDGRYPAQAIFEAVVAGKKTLVGTGTLTATLAGNRRRGTFTGTTTLDGAPVSGSFSCG